MGWKPSIDTCYLVDRPISASVAQGICPGSDPEPLRRAVSQHAVALKHGAQGGGGAAEVLDVLAWVRQPQPPGSPDGADRGFDRYESLVSALETLAEASGGDGPAASSAPAAM